MKAVTKSTIREESVGTTKVRDKHRPSKLPINLAPYEDARTFGSERYTALDLVSTPCRAPASLPIYSRTS